MIEKPNEDYVEQLKEIRSLMERSSRFISLSGLSGISTGIIALAGAAMAWWHLHYKLEPQVNYSAANPQLIQFKLLLFLILDAIFVLVFATAAAVFFAVRKSHRQHLPVWNKAAELTFVSLLIPLLTGGIFCIILMAHHYYLLIAPITLVFYGLALLNASKYTFKEIQYLGILEIVLGLVSSMVLNYSLIFWAVGFGALHIIYGTIMYYRYEK